MSDVSLIFEAIDQGDPHAAEKLLPLVYDELRKLAAARMARELPDQTLQATALVHEAYLRLVSSTDAQRWKGRGHFFGAAAEAMRRVLLDRARDKGRLKRGGQRRRISLDEIELAEDVPAEDLDAVDESINRLAAAHPDCAQLVKLRFFGGLSLKDAAAAAGISVIAAKRHWIFARAWLFDDLKPDQHSMAN